jgi:hypothetical protein
MRQARSCTETIQNVEAPPESLFMKKTEKGKCLNSNVINVDKIFEVHQMLLDDLLFLVTDSNLLRTRLKTSAISSGTFGD